MSIFNTTNLLTSPATTTPAIVISNPPPGQLTFGIFYIPGTVFDGSHGRFVKT